LADLNIASTNVYLLDGAGAGVAGAGAGAAVAGAEAGAAGGLAGVVVAGVDGCVSGERPPITEAGPLLPMIPSASARAPSMKSTASPLVSFVSNVAPPRAPKAA